MKYCIFVFETNVLHFLSCHFAPFSWLLFCLAKNRVMHKTECKLRQEDISFCPEYHLWEVVNTGGFINQIPKYFSINVNSFCCAHFFFSAFVGCSCAGMILCWWKTLNWPSNLFLAQRGVHEERASANLICLIAVTFWFFLRIKTSMRKEMR